MSTTAGDNSGAAVPPAVMLNMTDDPKNSSAIGLSDDAPVSKENWHRIRELTRHEVGDDVFSSWFERVECEDLRDGVMYVSVPTKFVKAWLEKHFLSRFLKCSRIVFPELTEVRFFVRGPNGQPPVNMAQMPQPQAHNTIENPESGFRAAGTSRSSQGKILSSPGCEISGAPLENRLTFDNFVVGAPNRLAFAAAKQVAGTVRTQQLAYNPLYIHAGVGLGKTHLLHAISWEVQRLNPKAKVLYLTAEHFLYTFVGALSGTGQDKMRNALAFKERLRGIDILLMDDLSFLNGPATSQEFGHTLNALIEAGKQVVVAADRPPSHLERLDPRIRSRLAGGLIVEINPLDFDLRLKILRRHVEIERQNNPDFNLPDDWLKLIATKLTQSGRELEGAIKNFKARLIAGERITIDTVEDVIRSLSGGQNMRVVKIDNILRLISKQYNISRNDLLSARRTRSIVRPRQIGMYLAKELTKRSLPEIGRKFGGRDHTTVIHAINKVKQLMAEDRNLRDEIQLLTRLLCD